MFTPTIRMPAHDIVHVPRHDHSIKEPAPVDPVFCEKLLTDWFGHPVILLSSGRAGINIALKVMGFHRYKSSLRVPPYLSTCVLNSITPFAFPVFINNHGDGMLWQHQYGFPQTNPPCHKNVIEDCAHNFFYTANSGERRWVGDLAIFSLPKFFNIQGMAGGIIVLNPEYEEPLRLIVEQAPEDDPEARKWMRQIIANAFNFKAPQTERLFIDSAYQLLLQFIRPESEDLAGFPLSLNAIKAVGGMRRERMEFVVDYFGKEAFPTSMLQNYEHIMPFAMPYFEISDQQLLEKANRLLTDAEIHAGIYHVDINRDCLNPDYRPCLLLPCHQDVPPKRLEEACKIIASCRQ